MIDSSSINDCVTSVSATNGENHSKNAKSFQLKSHQKSYPTYYDYVMEMGKKLGQDKAFYTYDLGDILWKAQHWKDCFPNVDPYFAVKANADPKIIRLFVLLGYGFDCSTEGEMALALEAGANPKRIIFAHTVKIPKALKYASETGVDLMTFDSAEELVKIYDHFPQARLVLRLKSESLQKLFNLSKKFGCVIDEAEDLLIQAKRLKLNVVGVSFHVGGLCEDSRTFTSTIENVRSIFAIARQIGFHFTMVNIGAGFFGAKEREDYFRELAREINISLKKNFPDGEIRFMAEPGCYCVASSGTLTTSIIGKKSLKNIPDGIQREYFLNESFYGSFFDHNEKYGFLPRAVLIPSEFKRRAKYRSKLWGQTCCSEDVLKAECLMPDMQNGELIIWMNVGAYSQGLFSNFTLVPTPVTGYVFVRNCRLKSNWIVNIQEVTDFISETAILIENEAHEELNGH